MKTINVAVVGAGGWIGSVHSECYARLQNTLPDVHVVLHTAVDVVEDNVRKVAAQYGFLHATTDYRYAINNSDIQIIDICCNNNFHRQIAIEAAKAKKHVLCEKPLAMNTADAYDMVEAASLNGIVNGCNLIHRKYPGIVFIKQLLDEGKLGKPYYMKAYIEQDSHADPMDMHAWLFNKAKAGGGSIATNGTHIIDLCRFFMGDFAEVSAISETFIKERPMFRSDQIGKASSLSFTGYTADTAADEKMKVDVDDATGVLVRFQNGGFGVLMSSWAKQGTRHNVGFEIIGSKGTAAFDTERLNEVRLYLNEGGTRDRIGYTTIIMGNEHPYGLLNNMKTGHGIGGKDVFAIMIREFVEAVTVGKPMSPNFYDGYVTVKYLKAIQKAAEEHRWVNPEDEGI